MKKLWIPFLIAFAVGFVLSCEKNGSVKWVFSSDITVTDIDGNVYKTDPCDWCGNCQHRYVPDYRATGLPTSYSFGYAYPNPAKDSTIIRFALPQSDYVHLWIEDKLGGNVTTLVDGIETAGYKEYVWYLQDSDGKRVMEGIYRANIQTGLNFHCDDGDILVE